MVGELPNFVRDLAVLYLLSYLFCFPDDPLKPKVYNKLPEFQLDVIVVLSTAFWMLLFRCGSMDVVRRTMDHPIDETR